jgi:hypothetical protein
MGPTLLGPMNNQGKFSLESIFAFPNLRIFIIKYPGISFSPDAPKHQDYDIHCKRQLDGSFYVSCGPVRL